MVLVYPISYIIVGNVRGTYLYIETSSHNQNEYADLVSPLMTGNQDRCLSLWYHMFGSDIDQLEIGIIQVNIINENLTFRNT